jgi:hypothetical protein
MIKLIDLVRDYRQRRATAEEEGEITMEVIDQDGNHLGGSVRRGKRHIRVFTGVARAPDDPDKR